MLQETNIPALRPSRASQGDYRLGWASERHRACRRDEYIDFNLTDRLDEAASNLDVPSFAFAKRVYWRGPTGSPYGGTEAVLPVFPPHTVLLEVFCKRFEPASQSLQIDVTDASGAIVYGTVTLAAGAMEGRGYIGKEIGFQIPSSALKLKFTGTPEIVKGVVGIDYL